VLFESRLAFCDDGVDHSLCSDLPITLVNGWQLVTIVNRHGLKRRRQAADSASAFSSQEITVGIYRHYRMAVLVSWTGISAMGLFSSLHINNLSWLQEPGQVEVQRLYPVSERFVH